MSNLCENRITLIAHDERSELLLKELDSQIHSYDGLLLSHICPDKNWGTKYDVNFCDVQTSLNIADDRPSQLYLSFETDDTPADEAFIQFHNRLINDGYKLDLTVRYVEPTSSVIGYHIHKTNKGLIESDKTELDILYLGLVNNDDDANYFASKMNFDLQDIAEHWMCDRLIHDDDDCDCARCIVEIRE